MEKVKVVMSYCHNGMVHQPFMQSLFDLCFYELNRDKVKFSILDVSHAYIPQSRNFAVQKFLETDAEWLLFFDYDMVFQEDFLERMLEVVGEDKKIVCGLYFYTARGTDVIWPAWLDYDENLGKLRTVNSIAGDTAQEVFATGMGGTIIHRSVIEAVAKNYPDDDWKWFGHDLLNGERIGEDVTFCARARAAGFKVWGYTGTMMGHLKTRQLNFNTFVTQLNGMGIQAQKRDVTKDKSVKEKDESIR